MLGRHLPVLAIACLATVYCNEAGATATIGGVVGALANTGACNQSVSVPTDTFQDSFVLHTAAACGGGSASADLRGDAGTASIGIRGTSSGNGFGSSQASGAVLFTDHWLLTPPTGTADGTFINIPVKLKLEGSISPGAVLDDTFGRFLDYNLTISDLYFALSPGSAFSALGKISASGTFSETFSGSVNFYNFGSTAAPMTAVVEMSLFLPALLEGTVDFFNAASITMDLPPGFLATTSSGLPLDFAQAPASVAEPEAGALMLVGLGLLTFLARRRTA
jgi:hypothetical protein